MLSVYYDIQKSVVRCTISQRFENRIDIVMHYMHCTRRTAGCTKLFNSFIDENVLRKRRDVSTASNHASLLLSTP
jgi:hypothetical protein